MRARDFRDLREEELDARLADARQELFNLHFQSATGALENAAKVGDLVRIVETRPLSATKRWRLAEIVEAAK